MTQLIWLTIALPLAGVLINGLFGRRLGPRVVSWIVPLMVLLAFLVGVGAFFETMGREEAVHVTLWTWATVGDFNVPISLLVDQLSVLMILIVTGVGFLIHVYATEYMVHREETSGAPHPDRDFPRAVGLRSGTGCLVLPRPARLPL